MIAASFIDVKKEKEEETRDGGDGVADTLPPPVSPAPSGDLLSQVVCDSSGRPMVHENSFNAMKVCSTRRD